MAPKKTHHGLRTFFIFVAIVLTLFAAGYFAWNIYKYKFIKSKVKDAVYEKSNGLYTIRYDKMELDEVGGYLHVTNVRIIPDTARYMQLIAEKKNPPLLLQLTIPELKVTGVKTPQAMLGRKMEARKLEVSNPVVIFYYAKSHPYTSSTAANEQLYQQVLGNLKEIAADSVEVNNVSLAFIDIRSNKRMIESSGISVHLKDVLIDSAHANDKSRFFFARHVQVSGKETIVRSKTGPYIYHCTGVDFNNEGGMLSINTVAIEPQLSEEQFAARAKLQSDRFNFKFKGISLQHIDLVRLMNTDIIADELVLKQADFKIFRDLSYPRDKLVRVGKFPQQLLMDMPVWLALKKITIANAFIEYKEKNPKSNYSGKVQFTKAHAVITNVTNEPDLIKANDHCVLTFSSRFLDMVPMHARIDMLLNNSKGRFTFTGSVASFAGNKLNVLLQPMALAQVEKGNINKFNFDFSGYDYGADGKVTMLYDDLKITLLKKDSAENKFKKKKLVSLVANMLVKNANPLRKQPVRVADVHYERDTNRSFFNLMWKAIYAGIKQSAGM